MEIKAIIPARAGSKGIPDKNLKTVGGISLVARIVETAKKSGLFSEIIVTSDSSPILEIAQNLGVSPLERPEELSGDTTNARQVVEHVFLSKGIDSKQDQIIFYLQPTSPFTTVDTLSKILTKVQSTKCPVFSARVSDPLSKILLADEGMVAGAWRADVKPTSNRQDSVETYIATGGCYAFSVKDFYGWGDIPTLGAHLHIVNWPECVDIDSFEDLTAANIIERQWRCES